MRSYTPRISPVGPIILQKTERVTGGVTLRLFWCGCRRCGFVLGVVVIGFSAGVTFSTTRLTHRPTPASINQRRYCHQTATTQTQTNPHSGADRSTDKCHSTWKNGWNQTMYRGIMIPNGAGTVAQKTRKGKREEVRETAPICPQRQKTTKGQGKRCGVSTRRHSEAKKNANRTPSKGRGKFPKSTEFSMCSNHARIPVQDHRPFPIRGIPARPAASAPTLVPEGRKIDEGADRRRNPQHDRQ